MVQSKNIWMGMVPIQLAGLDNIRRLDFLTIQVFKIIDKNSHSVSDTLIAFFIPFVFLFILLMFICYGTGEKSKWRWGKIKK